MNLKKPFSEKIIFPFIVILGLLFLGLVNVYQPSTLNNDGSGSFKLSYNTPDSTITEVKVIGNFPFTETEAGANFSSPNTEVKTVNIFNDKEKLVTHVVVEIDFTDINKISEAKGFSNIKASWVKSDSGMVFNWTILKNPAQQSILGDQLYIFRFDGQILSSNGLINRDTVIWLASPKTFDFTNDVVFTAVVKPAEGSSCGLFGIELPFILAGAAYTYIRRGKSLKGK